MSTEDTKKAVTSAAAYLAGTLGVSGITKEKITNFRVEEAVPVDKGMRITISYEIAGDFPFERTKEYKDFEIDKDGNVLSMTIRKI